MTSRRSLLATLVAIGLAPRATLAQAKQPVRIGWLNNGSRKTSGNRLAEFKDALAALGWREHASYVLDEHWADARPDRLETLARELATKKPAVIVAAPTGSVAAAAKAAPRTPIVQATGADPVAAGFAANLARPGGMVTGITNVLGDLTEKSLELLLAAVPNLRRVGFLADPTALAYASYLKTAQRSVARHSIEARFGEARNPDELEPAIARLAKDGAQALIVLPSTFFGPARQSITTFALVQRWPVIAGSAEFAEAGVLLSYGPDREALYRRPAWYVDKILKGAKPGDLPIEQPTKFELVVNLKTAKALGLTLPQPFLMRADRVIE